MRKSRIAAALAALVLIIALPLSAQQQTEQAPAPTPDPNQPLPACADLYNANLRVSNLDDAVSDGTVYCREITRNGDYLLNPGAIGDQSVIARGVRQAYDVFGMTVAGVSTKTFSHTITICLEGRGDLLFLPVVGSPRPVLTTQSYIKGDYTCASVGSPGVIALVPQ